MSKSRERSRELLKYFLSSLYDSCDLHWGQSQEHDLDCLLDALGMPDPLPVCCYCHDYIYGQAACNDDDIFHGWCEINAKKTETT